MIMMNFVYTAPLKTGFTKCFDNPANAGNSGRQSVKLKQEGRTENVRTLKVNMINYK